MTVHPLPYPDDTDDFVCESCRETIPDDDRSFCPHYAVCSGCYAEHYCLECARDDHFYDEVDRQYAAFKDGH